MSQTQCLWRLLYERFLLAIEEDGMPTLYKSDAKGLAAKLADDAVGLMVKNRSLSVG